jgi:hypothetical protein
MHNTEAMMESLDLPPEIDETEEEATEVMEKETPDVTAINPKMKAQVIAPVKHIFVIVFYIFLVSTCIGMSNGRAHVVSFPTESRTYSSHKEC